MQIHLRLFAGLRQAAGFKEKVIELPDGATVADLLAELPESISGRTFNVAVNQSYTERNTVLHEGDEVALLPPVSGGIDSAHSVENKPRFSGGETP